jgi:hypothetical protein
MPAQVWSWARGGGGLGFDQGVKIVADNNGNSYAVGVFRSASIYFNSVMLINAGVNYEDFYIVKYDNAGNLVWAHSAGFDYECHAYDIALDINGDVLVTGEFTGTNMVIVGSLTLNATSAYSDMFLLKLNSSGTVLWGKLAASYLGPTESFAVATDPSANIFITGRYHDSPLSIETTTLINNGDDDMFIAKYNSSGNLLWAKSAGGVGWESGSGISCDASGNAYLTGRFSASLSLGSNTLTSSGSDDIFLAKYDPSGNVVWATKAGGSDFEEVTSVVNDNNGNSYITGSYRSDPVSFGSTTFTIAHPSTSDLFLAKYDNTGNLIWVRTAGGTYADVGYDISIHGSNLYLVGTFMSNAITFGTTTINNSSGNDLETFIVNYDLNGNVVWAKSIPSQGHNTGNGISANATNLFITGAYSGSYLKLGSDSLVNIGTTNVYVAKYNYTGVGIAELKDHKIDLMVFPNPTNDKVYLSSEYIFNNAEVMIFNSLGEKMKNFKNVSGQKFIISCVDLSKGVYTLQITEKNIKSTKKLIISD